METVCLLLLLLLLVFICLEMLFCPFYLLPLPLLYIIIFRGNLDWSVCGGVMWMLFMKYVLILHFPYPHCQKNKIKPTKTLGDDYSPTSSFSSPLPHPTNIHTHTLSQTNRFLIVVFVLMPFSGYTVTTVTLHLLCSSSTTLRFFLSSPTFPHSQKNCKM